MKITLKESIQDFDTLSKQISKLNDRLRFNLDSLVRRNEDWGSLSIEEAKDETLYYLDKLIKRINALKSEL